MWGPPPKYKNEILLMIFLDALTNIILLFLLFFI